MKSDPQMTAVFNCNLRRFKGNPHLVETPFGVAQTVGVGNIFEHADSLEEVVDVLLDAIDAECRLQPGSLLERAYLKAMQLRHNEASIASNSRSDPQREGGAA